MATSTDLRAAIEEVQNQIPAEGAQEGVLGYEQDWLKNIERRVGALPWWIISAVVHAVLFLLITLLAVALPQPVQDEVIISTDVAKEKPPEYDEKKPRDIFKNPNEIQAETMVENPILVHEQVEVSDHFETDNDMDQQTSRGQEDAISDIPLGGTGISGSIGVGGGGMAGCFGYRNGGGRKNAVGRFGGSPATESSVEAALRWLARHQEPDGHWECSKWEGGGISKVGSVVPNVADTSLALLAFLGAGYTEKSGQFADNVKRAEQWLLSQQQPDGCLAKPMIKLGYAHAMSGLALAEAYGMGQDEAIGEAAQKAVDYSINEHQLPYSGWRYFPKDKSGADLSVSGWFVMQLKSAKVAGLKVDGAGFQGAQGFLDSVSDGRGGAGYQDRRVTASTTAIGMVCREFMGAPATDQQIIGAGDILVQEKNLPKWKPVQESLDFYYLYYGTLGMFQLGGEHWKKWNEVLKPLLVDNQCKGGPLDGSVNDKDGSWDPYGRSGREGGRVFQTAVGALSLEVYYRYLPMYAK